MLQQRIAQQYGRPTGLLGHYIGLKMVRDHRPENEWTVNLLQPQPADHILELGFGAGFAIGLLARVVTQGQVVGLERSPTMVRLATLRNWRAVWRGRVRLHQGDAANLPFADSSFDKVFTINSIYFWQRPAQALAEIWRVLRPGGRLALTLLPKERWPGGPDAIQNTDTFYAWTADELFALLAAAGFTSLSVAAGSLPSNFSLTGYKAFPH
jgi:ubiquinone/menaquinone biosynthesis C-methylase UbiE